MSLIKYAERELRLAGFFDKDSDYEGTLGKAVMELIEVFSKQGHSGFSANRVVSLFEKVARYENLLPLTGEDSEWNDISDLDGGTLQNNRVSSVFKEKETARKHASDAAALDYGANYANLAFDVIQLGALMKSRKKQGVVNNG